MFKRVREIKGILYLYEETRWREGGKVRSKSRSLGPIARLFKIPEDQIGMKLIEQNIEKYDIPREKAAREKAEEERAAEAALTQSSSPETGQSDAPGSTEGEAGPPSDQ